MFTQYVAFYCIFINEFSGKVELFSLKTFTIFEFLAKIDHFIYNMEAFKLIDIKVLAGGKDADEIKNFQPLPTTASKWATFEIFEFSSYILA